MSSSQHDTPLKRKGASPGLDTLSTLASAASSADNHTISTTTTTTKNDEKSKKKRKLFSINHEEVSTDKKRKHKGTEEDATDRARMNVLLAAAQQKDDENMYLAPNNDELLASLPKQHQNVKVKQVVVDHKGAQQDKKKKPLPGHRLLSLKQGARLTSSTPKRKVYSPTSSPHTQQPAYSPDPVQNNQSGKHKQELYKSLGSTTTSATGTASATSLWDPNPEIPKQPYKLDLPRSRYDDDSIYASFSCQLIHVLDGSGRNFAKFEFFYSDIDRNWYDKNPFLIDLYKLGIPSPTTLPCTFVEWRMLRQKIPNRIKRYSPNFIKAQLLKLQDYRNTIRTIQKHYHNCNTIPSILTDCLEYDVPALIAVGRTVTAYHKKAKLLHRGIVLTRDLNRYGYLIQFERKELGCEFCPDYEVASHGPPRYIYRASKTFDGTTTNDSVSIGKLPHGTTFGPLVEYHKQNNRKALYQIKTERIRSGSGIIRALEFDEDDKPQQQLSAQLENMNILSSITEREIIIQFIHKIDGLIKRKQKILHALDVCHAHYEQHGINKSSTMQWNDHYKWLHANLNRTNLSLECFQVLMQMLYSKVYTGRPTRSMIVDRQRDLIKTRQTQQIQDLFNSSQGCSALNSTWIQTVYSQSLMVSAKSNISSKIIPTTTAIKAKPRQHYISSRLQSSSSILLAIYHCLHSIILQQQNEVKTPDFNSIQNVLLQLCKRFQPKEVRNSHEENNERENAYLLLVESVQMLCAELALFQVVDN